MPKLSQGQVIKQLLGRTPVTALDIETSGFMEKVLGSGVTHKGVVLEVGGLKTLGMGQHASEYQAFVDPRGQGVPLSEEWLQEYKRSKAFNELHGIATPFPGFQGKIEKIGEVKKKLTAMFPPSGQGLLIGYGAKKFDIPFLRERVGWSPGVSQQGQIVDVMEMAQRALPKLKDYKQITVASALGIKTSRGPLHRSLSDSDLTLQIFYKLSTGRYAKKSGIGEILKGVYGAKAFDQSKEMIQQTYWEGSGKGRKSPEDVSYSGISSKREQLHADVAQASVEDSRRMAFGESKASELEYAKVRAIEDAVFFGEHSPETLKLAGKRASFWEQISPKDIRSGFMRETLGLTEAQESMLRGGKAGKNLRKLFSTRMSEYELLGHLPRSEFLGQTPAGAETRVVGFGDYSLHPGSAYVGSLPGGKDVFIRAEQQKAFIDEVFGVTRTRRVVGTGKIATPEQLSRVQVTAPEGDIDTLRKLSSKAKVRRYIEAEISKEIPLAEKEAAGWVDPTVGTIVDKYAYNVGKGGGKKDIPKILDESEYFAETTRQAIEGSYLESGGTDLVGEAIGPPAETAPAADPWSLTGEATSGIDESFKGTQVEIQDTSVAYLENAKWHTKRLERLRSYSKEAFLYKWIGRGKGRVKKFLGFKARFELGYKSGVASFLHQELNLAGKTPQEIDIALENVKPGSGIKVLEGGKWKTIAAEDIKLSTLYLQDLAEKSAKFFTELKNPIPSRALAEKVFEVYFKRVKGKSGFGAYTAAGTFLGMTGKRYTSKGIAAKAYAKIFKGDKGYDIGWSEKSEPFYWSRFGAAELAENEERAKQGLAPKKEILSIWDVEEKYRLRTDSETRGMLARMYEQAGDDYKLISKYKLDRATNTYMDVETGKVVDKVIAETYMSKVNRVYARHAKYREMFAKGRVKSASAAGKIDEMLTGKAFSGKGNKLIYGALAISAALVSLSAFSSKKRVMAPSDVARQPYGATTDDQRMYEGGPTSRSPARITPEYGGRRGYTTNIDVSANDPGGVDHRDLARVMDRHARNTLGVSRGSVSMEINDNSDNTSDRSLKRKYQSMLRS